MKLNSLSMWLAAGVFVACLIVMLFYPFETTVVPEWKIHVVDVSGKPVPGVIVNEQWRNHSIEFNCHNEDATTDGQGHVSFPRRTVRASLAFRIVGTVVVHFNVHGQSGAKASAIVLGPYVSSTNADYAPGRPLPQVIVVAPQP
jgi:hypothetical protein